MPKNSCGPFDLTNIMTPCEYEAFWLDLSRLGLLGSVLDCEIMPTDDGKIYVSHIGPYQNLPTRTIKYKMLFRYTLADIKKYGLPIVMVTSKKKCMKKLAKYLQIFHEGKLFACPLF